MPGFQNPQQPQFAPMMNQMNPQFGNNPFFNPAMAPAFPQQQVNYLLLQRLQRCGEIADDNDDIQYCSQLSARIIFVVSHFFATHV